MSKLLHYSISKIFGEPNILIRQKNNNKKETTTNITHHAVIDHSTGKERCMRQDTKLLQHCILFELMNE